MTKKKVIIITSIAITLFILLSSICFLCIKKEIHKNDSSDSTLIKSSIEQKDDQLNVSDNNIQETKDEVKEQEEKQDNISSNKTKDIKNVKKEETPSVKKEEPIQEEQKPVVETPKEEQQIQPTQPVVQQPVNNSGPWDNYGISEYDYYHKPMWDWARVDYAISTYGSYESTHQACIDAGNQIEDAFSFSCTNINSYSGDYLGDMLRVKY